MSFTVTMIENLLKLMKDRQLALFTKFHYPKSFLVADAFVLKNIYKVALMSNSKNLILTTENGCKYFRMNSTIP